LTSWLPKAETLASSSHISSREGSSSGRGLEILFGLAARLSSTTSSSERIPDPILGPWQNARARRRLAQPYCERIERCGGRHQQRGPRVPRRRDHWRATSKHWNVLTFNGTRVWTQTIESIEPPDAKPANRTLLTRITAARRYPGSPTVDAKLPRVPRSAPARVDDGTGGSPLMRSPAVH
jgi:hypothetical protein